MSACVFCVEPGIWLFGCRQSKLSCMKWTYHGKVNYIACLKSGCLEYLEYEITRRGSCSRQFSKFKIIKGRIFWNKTHLGLLLRSGFHSLLWRRHLVSWVTRLCRTVPVIVLQNNFSRNFNIHHSIMDPGSFSYVFDHCKYESEYFWVYFNWITELIEKLFLYLLHFQWEF